MSSHFRHIDLDNTPDAVDRAKVFGGANDALTDLCIDALHLVESAFAFFRGVFPTQSVHFWWGESIHLPWQGEYWLRSADGQAITARPVGAEVEKLAGEILRLWDTQVDGGRAEPSWGVSYLSDALAASPKITMQALSVEVMLSVDSFLEHVKRGDLTTAMGWLASAFKNIIECTCQAQEIIGNPSDNARAAALVRHRENHEMKQQVFAWLDENRSAYPSMDSAAEAISQGLVPVKFRTARDWVGQWARRHPSARTR